MYLTHTHARTHAHNGLKVHTLELVHTLRLRIVTQLSSHLERLFSRVQAEATGQASERNIVSPHLELPGHLVRASTVATLANVLFAL